MKKIELVEKIGVGWNYYLKGIGSILFLKNGLKKKLQKKTLQTISEVIIMRYVQL
jgi:hypothetical protein